MEMSTCEEPRAPNGPSPIATASGQRSVMIFTLIHKSLNDYKAVRSTPNFKRYIELQLAMSMSPKFYLWVE